MYVFLGFDLLFGVDFYKYLERNMVAFYAASSVMVCIPVIWLYLKLTYKNIGVPWVRWTIENLVGNGLVKTSEFLNEID
ncbi:MAG: hypothetical protein CMQ21_02020 [Gammaproteobacteria bacterium]|nr:hypothetical protein [Gammaproteobacteria bacterium]